MKGLDKKIDKVNIQDQQSLDNNSFEFTNIQPDLDKTNPELDKFKTRPEVLETQVYTRPTAEKAVAGNVDINNSVVTSSSTNRTIIETTPEETVAKKGSVKGFLRKATRLIEKRTGFDPTNENGELLLGVVAVKLK